MGLLGKIKGRIYRIPLCREVRILHEERKRFLKEAEERFKREKPEHGSLEDYKDALRKHRVTYSEYMYSYEYWRLNEQERDEFVSTSEMQVIYRKLGDRNVREVFHDKVRFLPLFSRFVHRWWAMAKDLSLDEFRDKVSLFDIIAKPTDGTRGEGIFKISKEAVTDWQGLFERVRNANCLLEECIVACDEIAAFHPASLNTIRVVTFSNGNRCKVFAALLRMGVGDSVIDNTHAGGVYAPINVETGTIEVLAIDSHNNRFDAHPDTGKAILGFRIPCWEKIVETCEEATRAIPNIHFAGWDLCINKDGEVEIIEGNHAPDFDGGMQAPLKIGVKKKVQQSIIDVMSVDPMRKLPVWAV